MPDLAPEIARLDERSQTVRNIAIAVFVGILLLLLRDCGVTEQFRVTPAPHAVEKSAPSP